MVFIILVPRHLGIIPDGNRRLAKRIMKTPWKGHEMGLGKIKDVVGWCSELGIKTVTIYLLSLENLQKRPKRELKYLFRLAGNEIQEILQNAKHTVNKNKVRVSFFGKLDMLPPDLRDGISKVEQKTKRYSNHFLNLAIAYGGRQEIIEAARKMATDAKKGRINPAAINEGLMRKYLWAPELDDPEIIIRTGGEKRLSNFLPFQSTYSELVFLDKFWPELGKKDFFDAVKEFGERDRRFGK